jgi:hypothetical protein
MLSLCGMRYRRLAVTVPKSLVKLKWGDRPAFIDLPYVRHDLQNERYRSAK